MWGHESHVRCGVKCWSCTVCVCVSPGGATGAFKMDTLIDLDWSSTEATKPFKATLPAERLFFGETDGSLVSEQLLSGEGQSEED